MTYLNYYPFSPIFTYLYPNGPIHVPKDCEETMQAPEWGSLLSILDGSLTLVPLGDLDHVYHGGGRLLAFVRDPPPLSVEVGQRPQGGGGGIGGRVRGGAGGGGGGREGRWGFGLWACLPDPNRALGAHGVPLIGEVRLRRTALTLEPCGARAGYTPPSADVLVLARDNGAWHMQGMESGSRFFTRSVLESVACEPLLRPTGARDA